MREYGKSSDERSTIICHIYSEIMGLGKKQNCTETTNPDLAVQVELFFFVTHLKSAEAYGHKGLPSRCSIAIVLGKFFST